MKTFITLACIFSLATLLTGCAFMPETINLHPGLTSANTSNIGQGKNIVVNVTDERAQLTLGSRASYIGGMASINSATDLTTTIQNTIFEGLRSKGFNPILATDYTNSSPVLNVKIRALQYKELIHPVNLEIVVSSEIEIAAINNKLEFDHIYQAQNIQTVLTAPLTSYDEMMINGVLSRTLSHIINDQDLLVFLSK